MPNTIDLEALVLGDNKEEEKLYNLIENQIVKPNVKKFRNREDSYEVFPDTYMAFVSNVKSGKYYGNNSHTDIKKYCRRIFKNKISTLTEKKKKKKEFLEEYKKIRSDDVYNSFKKSNIIIEETDSVVFIDLLKKELEDKFNNEFESDYLKLLEIMDNSQLSQIIMKHLSQLGEKCQVLIRLAYLDGTSRKEMGEILERSDKGVKISLSRCMKRLIERINP